MARRRKRARKLASCLRAGARAASLCLSCRYATPLMCWYIARGNTSGLTVSCERQLLTKALPSGGLAYLLVANPCKKVTSCKRYEKGPLPPAGETWADMEKEDGSCPRSTRWR